MDVETHCMRLPRAEREYKKPHNQFFNQTLFLNESIFLYAVF